MTSGGDELAYYAAAPGLERGSRSPGGAWGNTPFTVSNYGSLGVGAGYNGDALGLYVDFPSDTGITGFPYSGAATSSARCAPVHPPPPTGKRLSASEVGCDLFYPDLPYAVFRCTADVGDASGRSPLLHPSGAVRFTVDAGGGGSFGGARTASCQLAASQTGGNTSFCSVPYNPPAHGIPIGSQPPITVTYAGDATFGDSSAKPRSLFAVCPPILTARDTPRAVVGGPPVPPASGPLPTPPCGEKALKTFDQNSQNCSQAADPLGRTAPEVRPAVAFNPAVQLNVSEDSWGMSVAKVSAIPTRGLITCVGALSYGVGATAEVAGTNNVLAAQSATGAVMIVTGAETPIPVVNLTVAGAGAILEIAAAAQLIAANTIAKPLQSLGSTLVNDPPDRRFRSIPTLAHVRAIPLAAHSPTALRDLVQFKLASQRFQAAGRAMTIAVNRAGGAKAAHNRRWEGRQMRAALGFRTIVISQLKTLMRLQPRLKREVAAVTRVLKPVTAKQLAAAKARVRKRLPAATARLLKAFGITQATLRANLAHAVVGKAVPQGLQISPYLTSTMGVGIAVVQFYARVPQIKTEAALK